MPEIEREGRDSSKGATQPEEREVERLHAQQPATATEMLSSRHATAMSIIFMCQKKAKASAIAKLFPER